MPVVDVAQVRAIIALGPDLRHWNAAAAALTLRLARSGEPVDELLSALPVDARMHVLGDILRADPERADVRRQILDSLHSTTEPAERYGLLFEVGGDDGRPRFTEQLIHLAEDLDDRRCASVFAHLAEHDPSRAALLARRMVELARCIDGSCAVRLANWSIISGHLARADASWLFSTLLDEMAVGWRSEALAGDRVSVKDLAPVVRVLEGDV